ncbi:MAG: site-specific DNA-methyltransferase [Candidatus Brocadiia bacterium]
MCGSLWKTDQLVKLSRTYDPDSEVVFYHGDVRSLLPDIPDESVQLVVTSPPYNIGKEYEKDRTLREYRAFHRSVISRLVRLLRPQGSLCWQVGNYVDDGEILPLDYLFHNMFSEFGLHLRNRIIWRFRHGLHCANRFSGRYETILWYTKTDDYVFNLDPVRVPQRYPGKKHYKGPKRGQKSGNPLGKNPSDVWDIPNVKSNHCEKTIHPCQFPVELVERLVLALTDEGDTVMDPYAGVGSVAVAALKRKRKSISAETVGKYVDVAIDRIMKMARGDLKTRPMNKPVHEPDTDPRYVQQFIGGILDDSEEED